MTAGTEYPSSYTAFGLRAEARPLDPGLHIVATPIGNLADISLRALETLAAADVIVAEDTRVTRTLLAHYGITTPMLTYHDHNAAAMRPQILERLAAGGKIALVSDAGTPLVSDPGYKLVAEAVSEGHKVVAIPGASAVLTALVVAGLPSDRFFFEGFLPHKQTARRKRISELRSIPGTLVFYEGNSRVAAMLADLADILGDRQAVVARELTKKFEQIRRGSLNSLAAELTAEGPPKGEIAVLVAPPDDNQVTITVAETDALLREALDNLSVKDAAAKVASQSGQKRRDLYARAVAIAEDRKTVKLNDD